MSPNLQVDPDRLAALCEKWKIARLELFGSVLREDFGPESDVDVLVSYRPDAEWSLMDTVEIESELSTLFGRRVDLVSRRAVERSYNWVRRRAILGSARNLHAAG